ncbi:MAG: PHB depolymerase family esterase [Candidatus Omnitrophota bacterium]
MKRYKRIAASTFFLLLGTFLVCQGISAQGAWRERVREKIEERSSQRIEKRQGKKITKPGDYDLSLQHDGLKRTYIVHVPSSYNKTGPTPLILAFHGGMGFKEHMATDKYYNLISKSDKEGFIVVFPNGASKLRSGKFATWNAGNCCGYARDNNIDDVGFVKEMIDDIKSKLNIDPKRIYATGMSNGGMFSYRLACDLTDTFAAIASVAGTDNYDSCNPTAPISIMHIHAKDDTHVLFNGGCGPEAFKDPTKVTDFTAVPETISRWVKRNNCNNVPKRVLEKEGVYCDLYTGCDGNVQVKLCVTETGGHSWPGGYKPPRENVVPPSKAISAADEIWDFFSNLPGE